MNPFDDPTPDIQELSRYFWNLFSIYRKSYQAAHMDGFQSLDDLSIANLEPNINQTRNSNHSETIHSSSSTKISVDVGNYLGSDSGESNPFEDDEDTVNDPRDTPTSLMSLMNEALVASERQRCSSEQGARRKFNRQGIALDRNNCNSADANMQPTNENSHIGLENMILAKPQLPPRLPPRPQDTSRPGLAPPPLPARPTGSKSSVISEPPPLVTSPTTANYYLKRETVLIPTTTSLNRRFPTSESIANIEQVGKTKSMIFSGLYAVTLNVTLRVWYLPTGENTCTFTLPDSKIYAMSFIPARPLLIWVSTERGELLELDISNGCKIFCKRFVHNVTVTMIWKHDVNMFTLDDNGGLKIWSASESGKCDFDEGRPRTLRIGTKYTATLTIGLRLWCIGGKTVEIYDLDESAESLLIKKHDLIGVYNISCISSLMSINEVYVGHEDGKVSVFCSETFVKKKVIQTSSYKITSIMGVGTKYVWIGYSVGKIAVFDTTICESWALLKDFSVYHNSSVMSLDLDETSMCMRGSMDLASISENGNLKFWDGFLTSDKIEARMIQSASQYTAKRPVKVVLLSWNIDSRKPSDMDLSGDQNDRTFFNTAISEHPDVDIFVVGFQELVDLESKSQTAKSLLKGNNNNQSNIDQRFKLWQERILLAFQTALPNDNFNIIECRQLVGLFQCILHKSGRRFLPKDVGVCLVKTGLGGYHGNKGAVVTRFLLEDTPFCFVNCHLAAHQNQISARNNDISQILKDCSFTALARKGAWERGGDGSLILDHEIVFWSGDLNYRIDLPRKETLIAIEQQKYAYLWENDQLIRQKNDNSSFGLRDFFESPLDFAPTFKYDRGSLQYDSGEKQRVPAYCDRILHKGKEITPVSYSRLECKISDHRPILGVFKCNIRKIEVKSYDSVESDATAAVLTELHAEIRMQKIAHVVKTLNIEREEAIKTLEDARWDLSFISLL